MYLPIKLSDVPVLLLASINLFVHSLTLVLIFRKGQPNLLSCKILFLFHSCYHYYCCILNFNTHSPPHFENNSMKIFKRSTFVFFFSGSVDTIVFSKTGNHLPQCLWFSNSFFTVDSCIDCVKGILNS